jgi:transcriptional regulator with XRE-family HTH domain
MTGASATLRRRELGMHLRQLRDDLGLTVEDVGGKLLWSPTKVSRMETGARRPSQRDVRDLCALYGVGEATSAELVNLARESREQGWWTQYHDLILAPYVGLEQEASAICCFPTFYVPALLQPEVYARAIIKASGSAVSTDWSVQPGLGTAP